MLSLVCGITHLVQSGTSYSLLAFVRSLIPKSDLSSPRRCCALERVVADAARCREFVEGRAAHRQTRCEHELLGLLGGMLAVMENIAGRRRGRPPPAAVVDNTPPPAAAPPDHH